MTRADVDLCRRVLVEVRAQLGADDWSRVSGITVHVRGKPGPDDFERGASPTQKASYFGVPCDQGQQGAVELPDPAPATGEIMLYLDNLAPITEERIRIALLHEYGHALGHDEETLWAMGLYLEDGSPPCTPS